MNQEVTYFIENLSQPWQVEVFNRLRKLVHETIPSVEERIQYKKPHFSEERTFCRSDFPFQRRHSVHDHEYYRVVSTEKFRGPPEWKWLKIREGDSPDYGLLSQLLNKASSSL